MLEIYRTKEKRVISYYRPLSLLVEKLSVRHVECRDWVLGHSRKYRSQLLRLNGIIPIAMKRFPHDAE